MCGRFRNAVPWRKLKDDTAQLQLPTVAPDDFHAPNLQPLYDIRPMTEAPILRPVDSGLELVSLRWGLIPFWHKGPIKAHKLSTFNAKSETAATSSCFREAWKGRRCLIPADGYYEWTGERGKKTKWEVARADGEWFCFAGLWDRAHTEDAGVVESFTMLTTLPGPDLEPYHHREPVALERSEWAAWLDPTVDPASLLRPGEAGSMTVRRAELEAA